jgi:hypothetical protein
VRLSPHSAQNVEYFFHGLRYPGWIVYTCLMVMVKLSLSSP